MTDQETAPAPAPAAESRATPWRHLALLVVLVLAAAVAVGALGGWLWYLWWGPPASGRIFETVEGIKWYPDPWDPGQHQVFTGTAEYTLVGIAGGVVLGIVAAVLGRRQALPALVVLLAASGLAAYVAFFVGTTISPPDPQTYATEEHLDEEHPAAIEVTGWTPYLAWPIGSLGAFAATAVAVSGAREVRRQQVGQQQAGNWLERPVGN